MRRTDQAARRIYVVQMYVVRVALLAVLWVLLTGGAVSSWVVGCPAILLGSAVSLVLPSFPPWRWRALGAVRFLAYFLVQSLVSGVDVALRVLRPRRSWAPRLITYRFLRLHGPARIFFANALSLLPGTLSADLREEEVLVHVLNHRQPVARDLQRLEQKVAGLFGMDWREPPGTPGGLRDE